MASWVKRFVNEAILRNDLERWGAMYRLEDGKYYHISTTAYSLAEAERYFKKNLSDWELHEFKPSYTTKNVIKAHNYLYVYYIGKGD